MNQMEQVFMLGHRLAAGFFGLDIDAFLTSPKITRGILYIGVAAQLIIFLCLIGHFIAGRRQSRVAVPQPLLYCAMIATFMLLVYAGARHDPVFAFGQVLNLAICLRAIELIRASRRASSSDEGEAAPRFPQVRPDTAEQDQLPG